MYLLIEKFEENLQISCQILFRQLSVVIHENFRVHRYIEMDNEQYQARIDAEADAKTDVNVMLWLIIGFFCNFIGIIIALVYSPSLNITRFFGKTTLYTLFYEKVYKSIVKRLQIIYALCGFLTPYLIVIIYYMFAEFRTHIDVIIH